LDKSCCEAEGERLLNTIARRDAVVHPAATKYPAVGLVAAQDALGSVIQYIDSVRERFAPYMIGYRAMLEYHADFVSAFGQAKPVPLRFRTLETPRDLIDAL